MSASASSNPLIAFYKGTAGDHRGRFLWEILEWSDEDLEYHHDYIQTIFPLPEQSGVQCSSPVVDREVFRAFREDETLKENLQKAFLRIISFYGLKLKGETGDLQMLVGPNYPKQAQNWVRRFDHNHLRITRIIRSLRILGLEEEAQVFFQACQAITKSSNSRGPSERSLLFWERAAMRPLNVAPGVKDEDVSANMGAGFLREYERAKSAAAAEGKAAELELEGGQGVLKKGDTSNIGTPKMMEEFDVSSLPSMPEKPEPDKHPPGKKQSKLELFFKKKGRKVAGNSGSDDSATDLTAVGRPGASKEMAAKGDEKGETRNIAQKSAQETEESPSQKEAGSANIRRPGLGRVDSGSLKRKAGEL